MSIILTGKYIRMKGIRDAVSPQSCHNNSLHVLAAIYFKRMNN
jgi:hypothetical protein